MYSNLFSYQLYIGVCLVLMLVYSVIFFFLAIYVERVNPGEFGISQSWYFPCKKSYWKPQASASVQPFDERFQKQRASMIADAHNRWVEVKGKFDAMGEQSASLMVSHVTKVNRSRLNGNRTSRSLCVDVEIWEVCGCLRSIVELLRRRGVFIAGSQWSW